MEIAFNENISKRIELSLENGSPYIVEELREWRKSLSLFMKNFIPKDKKVCLVTLNISSKSIIYEVSKSIKKVSKQGERYQFTVVDALSENNLIALLMDEEFYLGDLIIGFVHSNCEDAFIDKLIALKFSKNSPYYSFIKNQYVFMENDGNMFCWTNPSFSLNESKEYLNEIINK